MGASTLERRLGRVGQVAGEVDRGHGALSPCLVDVREGRCCRRWCVAGHLWRWIELPREMGDGCSPRSRTVAAKVNPGEGTRGLQSRGIRRVARAPGR